MVFTTRLSGGKGGRNGFETELRRLGVVQKNSRPNHPTTCGKVERVQQTFKNWLRAQPDQPAALSQLQTLLDAFVEVYNHRPPAPLAAPPATPAGIYTSLPKAAPTGDREQRHPRPRPPRHHRHRRIGHPARQRPPPPHRHRPNPRPNPRHPAHPRPPRPRRRRRHRRTPPRTDHQSQQGLPTHRKKTKPPNPHNAGSGVSDVLRHHMGAPGRIRTCATASGGRSINTSGTAIDPYGRNQTLRRPRILCDAHRFIAQTIARVAVSAGLLTPAHGVLRTHWPARDRRIGRRPCGRDDRPPECERRGTARHVRAGLSTHSMAAWSVSGRCKSLHCWQCPRGSAGSAGPLLALVPNADSVARLARRHRVAAQGSCLPPSPVGHPTAHRLRDWLNSAGR